MPLPFHCHRILGAECSERCQVDARHAAMLPEWIDGDRADAAHKGGALSRSLSKRLGAIRLELPVH